MTPIFAFRSWADHHWGELYVHRNVSHSHEVLARLGARRSIVGLRTVSFGVFSIARVGIALTFAIVIGVSAVFRRTIQLAFLSPDSLFHKTSQGKICA